MNEFDKDDMEDNNFNNNDEGLRKLENLLSKMFDSEGFKIEKNNESAANLEEKFGEPTNIEIIIKGEWTITITTWKRENGIITEKVEFEGPSKELPEDIQDFIKDRVKNKQNGERKKIVDSSENIEDLIDNLFKKEKSKTNWAHEDDFNSVTNIAKFWFFNRAPDYDELITNALVDENYEKAAYVRDKKIAYETFNEVALEKLQEAVTNKDFVAIDSIMHAYKSRIGDIIEF